MSDTSSRSPLPVVPMIIAGVVLLIGCLLIAFTLYQALGSSARAGQPIQVAQVTPLATHRGVTLFTSTPLPTSTPTSTPTPTDTPTPTPTPTATRIPATRVPPTAVPTAVPPTNPPPPTSVPGRGWVDNIQLSVPTDVNTTTNIVFSFHLHNSRGIGWTFGCIGVKVFDSSGGLFRSQWSLGNSALIPIAWNADLNWSDHVKYISTPGVYNIQLWIRYDASLCGDGGGDWESLTPGGYNVNVH